MLSTAVQLHAILEILPALVCLATRAAHLLSQSKNTQLLALSPQQLQQRLQALCTAMHWRPDSIHAAAAATGIQAFLQLLAADPAQTQQQVEQLAAALAASEEACAAFAQHYPRQLLQQQHAAALVRPQLQVLAAAAGVSISSLLEELEADQAQGLAGLLLYEAGWLREQLRLLGSLLEVLLGASYGALLCCYIILS